MIDSVTQWITPAGHTYPVEPESLGTVTTVTPATHVEATEPAPF